MWSISGMIMTGENRITRRRTCPSASMSTTNLTRSDVQSTPGLRGEKPAANRLSQSLCSHLFIRRDLTNSKIFLVRIASDRPRVAPGASQIQNFASPPICPGRADRLVSFRMTTNQYRRPLLSYEPYVNCTTRTC